MIRTLFAVAMTAALAAPVSALAHSPVTASAPASGAELSAAPAEIALTFKAPVRLTKVTVTGADGDAAELDLSAAKAFMTDFHLPCEIGGSGAFEVIWRALAKDGHAMKGAFSFTVK